MCSTIVLYHLLLLLLFFNSIFTLGYRISSLKLADETSLCEIQRCFFTVFDSWNELQLRTKKETQRLLSDIPKIWLSYFFFSFSTKFTVKSNYLFSTNIQRQLIVFFGEFYIVDIFNKNNNNDNENIYLVNFHSLMPAPRATFR